MNSDMAGRLIQVWALGSDKQREELNKLWPELAAAAKLFASDSRINYLHLASSGSRDDLLERIVRMLVGRELSSPKRRIAKSTDKRCEATHNPGTWPYVQRCALVADHDLPNDHLDWEGYEWKTACSKCVELKEKQKNITPGNEEEFYTLRREEKEHRKECPNK